VRRSLLILVTTVLVLSGAAVWAAVIWRAPRDTQEAAAVEPPPPPPTTPGPSTTKGAVVVVVPPAPTTTTTTKAPSAKPSGAGFVPGGSVGVVGYREVDHASPNCTIVVTRVANNGTAPVGALVLDFVVESGFADASGMTYWRAAQPFGALSRTDLELAPGTETDVEWEVCLTEFDAVTSAVRAEPLAETLDWTWKL